MSSISKKTTLIEFAAIVADALENARIIATYGLGAAQKSRTQRDWHAPAGWHIQERMRQNRVLSVNTEGSARQPGL
jgi:hypothetical protein